MLMRAITDENPNIERRWAGRLNRLRSTRSSVDDPYTRAAGRPTATMDRLSRTWIVTVVDQ